MAHRRRNGPGAVAFGLSATAKQLRSEGIMEADVSILSPKALGSSITMVVLVSLERERADIIDRFKQSLRSTREVMMGFYVTGDPDFMVLVTVKSMEDYEQFTRRFYYENPDIKGFKTMVVMDRGKAGFEFPIDSDDSMFNGGTPL